MSSIRTLFLSFLLSFVAMHCAQAEAVESEKELVRARIISTKQAETDTERQDVTLGIHLEIEEGWHIYWRNSGESGMPTRVEWSLPAGSSIDVLQWPAPRSFLERGDILTFGYKDSVTLLADATVSSDEGSAIDIAAKVRWLVCKDICIPGSADLQVDLSQEIEGREHLLIEKARLSIPSDELQQKISAFSAKDASGNLAIYLKIRESFSSLQEASKNIQVFPHESETYVFGRAKVALGTEKKPEVYIRIPLTSSNSEDSNIVSCSGVLSIKTADKTVKHLHWKSEVGEPSEAVLANSFWEGAEQTTFRRIEHTEDHNELIELNANRSISLVWAIFYGFLGGLILNLMPCVLPIISIKVMSFLSGANKTRADAITSSMSYSAGILFSFLVLASVVTLLRSLGFDLGWGFQFQHAEFVFPLIIVIFLIALGFFDIYTLSMPFMLEANKRTAKISPGKAKDFFDGILATALSTPCSAPFLGVALVVAFTQGPAATYSIFIAIGLGLAAPYFVLASNPRLIKLLPAPGPWMYRLRQFMGFLLLATIIWLLFVLGNLKDGAAMHAQIVMLAFFFMFWLWKWKKESHSKLLISILVSLGLLTAALVSIQSSVAILVDSSLSDSEIAWIEFSPEEVLRLREEGNPVFIDFTADWCVTCKANELYTLSATEVVAAFKEHGIATVKADWTSGDPVVTKALNKYGAKGVPHYVLLSADTDAPPYIFSTLPSRKNLISEFKRVGSQKD